MEIGPFKLIKLVQKWPGLKREKAAWLKLTCKPSQFFNVYLNIFQFQKIIKVKLFTGNFSTGSPLNNSNKIVKY